MSEKEEGNTSSSKKSGTPRLPPNWIQKQSRSRPGRTYFFHVITGESTWQHPNLREEKEQILKIGTNTEKEKATVCNPRRLQARSSVESSMKSTTQAVENSDIKNEDTDLSKSRRKKHKKKKRKRSHLDNEDDVLEKNEPLGKKSKPSRETSLNRNSTEDKTENPKSSHKSGHKKKKKHMHFDASKVRDEKQKSNSSVSHLSDAEQSIVVNFSSHRSLPGMSQPSLMSESCDSAVLRQDNVRGKQLEVDELNLKKISACRKLTDVEEVKDVTACSDKVTQKGERSLVGNKLCAPSDKQDREDPGSTASKGSKSHPKRQSPCPLIHPDFTNKSFKSIPYPLLMKGKSFKLPASEVSSSEPEKCSSENKFISSSLTLNKSSPVLSHAYITRHNKDKKSLMEKLYQEKPLLRELQYSEEKNESISLKENAQSNVCSSPETLLTLHDVHDCQTSYQDHDTAGSQLINNATAKELDNCLLRNENAKHSITALESAENEVVHAKSFPKACNLGGSASKNTNEGCGHDSSNADLDLNSDMLDGKTPLVGDARSDSRNLAHISPAAARIQNRAGEGILDASSNGQPLCGNVQATEKGLDLRFSGPTSGSCRQDPVSVGYGPQARQSLPGKALSNTGIETAVGNVGSGFQHEHLLGSQSPQPSGDVSFLVSACDSHRHSGHDMTFHTSQEVDRDIEDMETDEDIAELLSNLQDVRKQVQQKSGEVTGELTQTIAEGKHSVCLSSSSAEQQSKEICISQRNPLVVIDTNVLISRMKFVRELLQSTCTNDVHPILVLPWVVLQELDKLKEDRPGSDAKMSLTSWRARVAVRFINEELMKKNPFVIGQSPVEANAKASFYVSNNDDRILQCCLQFVKKYSMEQVFLLTRDLNLVNKATILGLKAVDNQTLPSSLHKFSSSFESCIGPQESVASSKDTKTAGNQVIMWRPAQTLTSTSKCLSPMKEIRDMMEQECRNTEQSSESMSVEMNSAPGVTSPTSKTSLYMQQARAGEKEEVIGKFDTVWKLIFDVKNQIQEIVGKGEDHPNFKDAVEMLNRITPLSTALYQDFDNCLSLSPVILWEKKPQFTTLCEHLNQFFHKSGVSGTDPSPAVSADSLMIHFSVTDNRPQLLQGLEQLGQFIEEYQDLVSMDS